MDTPTRNEESEQPKVSGIIVVVGFILMVEGILISLASVPLVLFGGIGLLGMVGGAALIWAGWLLAGLSEGNARRASVVTIVAGGAVTFLIVVLIAMTTCASFVNCYSTPSYALFLLPLTFGAFNLACAVLLWRRGTTESRVPRA